ncbi:MAG TPA: hypothetical protein EYP98_15160, partial [Planctomycetes bacterium]|nr:hypothetical protein [Planctomycetota bacterium]
MRQFVVGLLAVGLALWGYGRWFAVDPAHASTELSGGQGNMPTAGDGLAQMLGGAQPATGTVLPLAAGGKGEVANGDTDKLKADIDKLLPLVNMGDADAISVAWAAIASGNLGREHDRVLDSLAPLGDDFSKQLAALGDNNSF